MDRAQKQEQIDYLKSVFGKIESMVLTSVEGLDASQVAELRKKLHESKVSFKVVKNKLAKIAISDSDVSVLGDDFIGSTAIAWSNTDAVGPAKVIVNFQKDVEKFKIKSGFNAGKRLGLDELKVLAKLPSLDELRTNILGLVQAVPAKLLAQVNAPASHMIAILQAKIDKEKESA